MPKFKIYKVITHVAAWLLFMAFPLLFLGEGLNGNSDSLQVLKSYHYWLFCLTYIFLFYINSYFFIPRLFLKGKYISYGVIVLVLFSLVFFLQPFDRMVRNNRDDRGWHREQQAEWKSLQQGNSLSGDIDHRPWNHQRGRPRRIDAISLFIFLIIIALSTAVKTMQQWQLTEQRVAQAEADRASAELSFLKAQINPH